MTKGSNHNRQAITPGSQPFQSMISTESSFWIERAVSFAIVWLTAAHPFFGAAVVILLIALAVFVVRKLARFALQVFRKAS